MCTGEEQKNEDSLLYDNLIDYPTPSNEGEGVERNCGNASKNDSEISPLDLSDEDMATVNTVTRNIEEEDYSVEAAKLGENISVSYSAPGKDAKEKLTDFTYTSGDCPMRTPLLSPIVPSECHGMRDAHVLVL